LPPVEGYSNFLWVLLVAPLYGVGLFDPVWTPKGIGLAATAGTFALLHRALGRAGPGPGWPSGFGLGLLAAQTAFVAWSVSGLENSLYGLLAAALLDRAMLAGVTGRRDARLAASAGLVAAGMGLTRPDGVIFAGLFPLVVALGPRRSSSLEATRIRALGWYGAALLGPLLAFGLFRFAYFGDLVPNPYHAKGGPTGRDLAALLTLRPAMRGKLLHLLSAVAGPAAWAVPLVALGALLVLGLTARLRVGHAVLGLGAALGALGFLLLPSDWMGEYRFATPFFVAFYPWTVLLAWSLGDALPGGPARRRLVGVLIGGSALAATLAVTAPRSLRFAAAPPLPLGIVTEVLGYRMNRLAASLGLESGSILLSDVGGPLLVSRLRVYDLHGLSDPAIARSLGRERDLKRFHDYVFRDTRPTFIHLATPDWVRVTGLKADPRFVRDYALLGERFGEDLPRRFGLTAYPGEYFVRRDAGATTRPRADAARPRRYARRRASW
jgi:hypothetical protein